MNPEELEYHWQEMLDWRSAEEVWHAIREGRKQKVKRIVFHIKENENN